MSGGLWSSRASGNPVSVENQQWQRHCSDNTAVATRKLGTPRIVEANLDVALGETHRIATHRVVGSDLHVAA
jgi:hypothetical protein